MAKQFVRRGGSLELEEDDWERLVIAVENNDMVAVVQICNLYIHINDPTQIPQPNNHSSAWNNAARIQRWLCYDVFGSLQQ